MLKDEFSVFTRELAASSAKFIMKYYDSTALDVETKSDKSPVTVADRGAEELMRGMIKKRFPAHGIVGEEFGTENPDAEFVWVLDPIDGTQSFIRTCPLFGTIICLKQNGIPTLGAVNLPVLSRLCIGSNEVTLINEKPVKMRSNKSLSQATLLLTDYSSIGKFQNKNGFEKLHSKISVARTWGDCFGYVMLAEGKADIMLDAIMNPWDLLALIPIIKGAGGAISAWDGSDPVKGNSIVACNKDLHAEVISLLNNK